MQLQLEVFHPIMMRTIVRKFDMDEPPVIEEAIEDEEKCIKQIKDNKGDEISLEEKYYK